MGLRWCLRGCGISGIRIIAPKKRWAGAVQHPPIFFFRECSFRPIIPLPAINGVLNPDEAGGFWGAFLFVGDEAFGSGMVELDFGEEIGVQLVFSAGGEEVLEGDFLGGAMSKETTEEGKQDDGDPPGDVFRLQEGFGSEVVLVGGDEEGGGKAEEADNKTAKKRAIHIYSKGNISSYQRTQRDAGKREVFGRGEEFVEDKEEDKASNARDETTNQNPC